MLYPILRLLSIVFICFLWSFISHEQKNIEGIKLNPTAGTHVGLKEVSVSIEEGYIVYYTTDGTTPTRASFRLRKNSLRLKGNTVFRFLIIAPKTYKRSYLTQSYFTERAHTLPVISIVSDPAHFFDSLTGIYAMGCCADTISPYMGANFWQKWEREINVEFFETDGTTAFNQPVGVRIFGGYSKAMPQKSLALFARKKYSDNRMRHKIFPDQNLKKYKNLVLRNAGGDMLGAHIRDAYATQLIRNTGLLTQAYRPASVYINGEYWGKYNLREKINEHFIKAYFGYDKDSLIIMRHNADHQHGPPGDYRKFIKKFKTLDLTNKEHLSYVHQKMDIDNYLLYNAAEVYTGNGDAGGNIRYYKSMRDTAKWRWIFYDLDNGMNINSANNYKINTLKKFTSYNDERWPNPPWSTLIIRKLLENDSIKHRYINYLSDILNTSYEPKNALEFINEQEQLVAEEIPHHLKRWKVSSKRYQQSMDDLKTFAEKRPDAVRGHIIEKFNLPGTVHITIDYKKNKGNVRFNSLTPKPEFSGIYLKDVPQIFEAHPYFDYEFVEWKHNGSNKSQQYESFTQDSVFIEAVFKKREYSPYRGKISITEIDATQSEENNSGDWIELKNITNETIDVSNWQLRDDNDDHVFIFPNNIKIRKNDFLIVYEDSIKFFSVYKDTLKTIGGFGFGIGKKKDKVRLYDAYGNIVDAVNLKNLKGEEKGEYNWVKKDERIVEFFSENWHLEKKTPEKESRYYLQLLKMEENDNWWRNVFFYIGISSGILALTLFFLFFAYKIKNRNNAGDE